MNGRAAVLIATGSLLVWSGVRGWSVLGVAGDLVTGRRPTQTAINTLTSGVIGDVTSGIGFASGSAAAIAQSYIGHAYRFGGSPGKNGANPWDCSSFVNYVMGVKLGRPIPGNAAGRYDGTSHGPTTVLWGSWSGIHHVKRGEVQAGDIVVWLDHMGIATSNTSMVSALNPQQGTRETPIEGYGNGPVLCYGRY